MTGEAEMRTVSEKTNGKVAWLSIISLAMCIAVFWFAIVQFEAKKMKNFLGILLSTFMDIGAEFISKKLEAAGCRDQIKQTMTMANNDEACTTIRTSRQSEGGDDQACDNVQG
ncbi:hypothetical protein JHK85_027837 [Glycine max]|nr:hypothetical protein JHK85_027837 [Glycine max]KAG5003195.1 hypothetical protein JHK86_027334 [Glycine max]